MQRWRPAITRAVMVHPATTRRVVTTRPGWFTQLTSAATPSRAVAALSTLAVLLMVFAMPPAHVAHGAPSDDNTGPPPLVTVPPGCPPGERADVTFNGVVVSRDETAQIVRFRIEQLRAGSASPWASGGLIDVRYGEDERFLTDGEPYLVGAAFDPDFGVLASAVRPPEPLFGGNDVVGLDDIETDCPVVETGVRTLHPDGSSVDSGVLSLMTEDRGRLLGSLAIPVAVTFVVLVALVVLRWIASVGIRGILELGRASVTPTADHRALRTRRHRHLGPSPDPDG